MRARWTPWMLSLAGLLCLSVAFLPKDPVEGTSRSPLTSLAASWQWIQFDQSIGAGHFEQAYLHADRALALDPDSPEGWSTLASHLIFLRGSYQNEPDDKKRIAWMQAGIDVLLEGTRQSREPAEVHLVLGQTLVAYIAHLAEVDEDPLPWPGGGEAARRMGMEHLQRALELHHPRAAKIIALLQTAHGLEKDQ